MKKVKDLFGSLSENGKKLFSKNPVTIIGIFITTFFLVSITETAETHEIVQRIITFAFIFVLQSFFVETIFKNKVGLIIGYVVSAVISTIFTMLLLPTVINTRSYRNNRKNTCTDIYLV